MAATATSGRQCRKRHLLGQGRADIFIHAGGLNRVMSFEPGVDRIEVSDMTEAGFRADAT